MGGDRAMTWYWHIHHNVLAEQSDDIEERIYFIKATKDPEEVPIRLLLMKKVEDEAGVASAMKAYDEARAPALEAYEEAMAPAVKAYQEAMASALEAYREAGVAPAMKAVEAIHKKECPECPWNGNTIFP